MAKAKSKAKSKASATFLDRTDLKPGAKGEAVAELQEFLQQFGYLSTAAGLVGGALLAVPVMLATSAEFDEATRKALTQYQNFRGLPPTGMLDRATAAEMSKPRCGFPDTTVGSAGAFVTMGKWQQAPGQDVALTYAFKKHSTKLTDEEDAQNAIKAAFDLWAAVAPLIFSEATSGVADIQISFETGNHGDGPQNAFRGKHGVLAHAFPPGAALGGDVHFDDAEDWSILLSEGGTDLVTVAAHEIGHALGLDHSDIRGALMYPDYSGPQRFLAQDDINGIQSLYGAK